MPPKVRITKDDIIDAAVKLVRQKGTLALNARNIAALLNCSTQPVFSNFKNMEDLSLAVVKRADELYAEYIKRETSMGEFPVYKASGMAYIRFAKEEKELFKLLYMRDRSSEHLSQENASFDIMVETIQNIMETDAETAKLFHLEMWAYVHGIATMFATGFLSLSRELVSKMLTDAYQGLKKQYGLE